jgi:hypothetical protein
VGRLEREKGEGKVGKGERGVGKGEMDKMI